MRKFATVFLLLFCFLSACAQQASVSGRIADSTEKKNLSLAAVSLLRKSDSSLVAFTRTNKEGKFIFPKTDTGQYVLYVTYPKFADFMDNLGVKADLDLGDVSLTPASKLLNEVIVRSGGAIRIKGDTTEFVADSFKVKDGATVEDLLKKLPGITVNSKGEIVAQGKRVDKVLVDGEEFFGDDPTMATQNISAKAVDRVQVFETKSDQQNLTGMTTGNEGKTVNIKLKEDAKKGAFGRIMAGTDFDKYIDSKILYNKFAGKKKMSVYVTRTNVNAGSLNWEDRQKLGIENDFEFDEISGYYFSFGGGDEFNDWNLRGLPDAWTVGALFSNKWNADKHNVNFSYRFNRLGTNNTGNTLTQNILSTGNTYSSRFTGRNALNQQHVINGKYEWKIDSLASVKFTFVNTWKTSHSKGYSNGDFQDANRDTVNQSFNDYNNSTDRKQTDAVATYKQLFKKKNRLWQTSFRYGTIDDDNGGLTNTRIRYFNNNIFDHADTVDQQKLFDGKSTSTGVKTTFTEPLSLAWMLVIDYAFNKNHSKSYRNTFEKSINGKYDIKIPEFSNNFILDAFSHSGNAILRYTGKKIKAGIGSGIAAVKLGLDNLNNNTFTAFHFLNLTPQAQINFTPKAQMNLSFSYRGTTRQPTISQLQPLRDNSDPLNEYKGNPDLKVGFNHGINLGFNQYKTLAQTWLGVNFSYNIQQNAITQFNTIDLVTGKRTYYPVNVNGNRNWNLWSSYNKTKKNEKLKNEFDYGFQLNGSGGRYNNFVNGQQATTKYFTINSSLQFGLEKEEVYEFNLNPALGYNYSQSSLSTSTNNNYFSYGGQASADLFLPWKIVVSTNINAELREKINAFANNTNLLMWNAMVFKKIFKKDAGKIGFYVNDILDDNKGFTRTINSTFITEDSYQRISRYFLLKFEWTFNKTPGGQSK